MGRTSFANHRPVNFERVPTLSASGVKSSDILSCCDRSKVPLQTPFNGLNSVIMGCANIETEPLNE